MLKISATALALTAICTVSTAQTATKSRPGDFGGLKDNWFVGAGGGITMLNEPDQGMFLNGVVTPEFEISVGKWFSPMFGLKVTAQGMNLIENVSPARGHVVDSQGRLNAKYYYLHGDILFNIMDMIGGYREDRWVNVIPYVNFGYIQRFDHDRDNFRREFAGGIGGLGLFHVNDRWDIYLDLRASIMQGRTFRRPTGGPAYLGSATVGVNYNITPGLWKPNGSPETVILCNDIGDSWFVGLGAGVGAYYDTYRKIGMRITPTADISIGKWFSPSLGARLGYQGGTMSGNAIESGPDLDFAYNYVHGDILWNVMNSFNKKPHIFDVIPYGHIGGMGFYNRPTDKRMTLEWAAGAGVIGSLRLDNRTNLFADARMFITKGNTAADPRNFSYGATAMLGLNYNFAFPKYNLNQSPVNPAFTEGKVKAGSFGADWFISVSAGANMLAEAWNGSGFNGRFTPSIDLAFGKWIAPYFGARLGWQGLTLSEWTTDNRGEYSTSQREDGAYQHNSNFQYIHMDLVTRPNKYVFPYLHWGIMPDWTQGWKNGCVELAGGLGIIASLPINSRTSAFIDLRETFLNGRSVHAGSKNTAFLTTASIGLNYQFNHSDWNDPAYAKYMGKFTDNMFFMVGGGVNTIVELGNSGAGGHLATNVEISAGKWLSDLMGLRLGYQRGSFGEFVSEERPGLSSNRQLRMGFGYTHADVLFKACKYVIPYIHMGFMDLNDHTGRNTGIEYAGGLGIIGKVPIGHGVSFVADARLAATSPAVTGRSTKGSINLLPTATIGLSYDLDANPSFRASPADTSGRLIYNRFPDNWFVSVSAGGMLMTESGAVASGSNAMVSPTIAISAGKWFHPHWGARLGWQGVELSEKTDNPRARFYEPDLGRVTANYHLIYADLMYRPLPWLSPYTRFGWIHTWNADGKTIRREYAAGIGALVQHRLSDNVGIFLDISGIFTPSRAFKSPSSKYTALASGTLGITYNINKAKWNSAQGAEKGIYVNNYGQNLFATAGAGIICLFEPREGRFNGHATPTYEATFGKWFSPEWGARIGIQGGRMSETLTTDRGQGKELNFQFGYAHADVLWNATTFFRGYKRKTMWDLIPYAHVGYLYNEFAAGPGVMSFFNAGRKIGMFADLRAYILKGNSTGAPNHYAYAMSAMVGVNYYIGKHDWDRVEKSDSVRIRDKQFAISTNIIDYADHGTINAELQYAVHRHWTLDAQFRYNRQIKEVFSAGVKWWPWYHYAGFWMKGALQAGTYEKWGLPWQRVDDRCEAAGAALSIGYSLMLCDWFNLDFGLGCWGGVRRSDNSPSVKGFFQGNELSVSAMFVF